MDKKETRIELKRANNRYLMVFYDAVVCMACWLSMLGILYEINTWTLLFAAVGCALIIGVRMFFHVYKIVLRLATMPVFARLICADVIADGLLLFGNLLLKQFAKGRELPFSFLVSIIAIIALVSIVTRVFYCYLYRFALGNSALSRMVRFLLAHFALVDFESSVSGATLHLVLKSQETTPVYINELQRIIEKFAIRGKVTSITQMNSGYINLTYRAETLSDTGHVHKYVLQRINTNVFRDVDLLMKNYKLITETLYGKLWVGESHEKGSVQTLRNTKDGCSYLRHESGCWRVLSYIDDVYSLDIPDAPETFENAGFAFGNFIKAAADIDIDAIKEVIPNFHNTKSRYADLEASIERDNAGRVKDVQKEIAFVRERADRFGIITDALESGEIPKRICHNDCNLNNILFDRKTHRPVAIIDLDTVMPSSPLYDFGDSIRIGSNPVKDDEKDLSKVSCNLEMYERYARGYLRACGEMLTKKELELLPYAALIITAEDGIRFLMDHIDGDIYYNISYPGQNLDRARTQLKLLEDMEKKLPQIKKILRKLYAQLGLCADI